jgi:hypothetical protein
MLKYSEQIPDGENTYFFHNTVSTLGGSNFAIFDDYYL